MNILSKQDVMYMQIAKSVAGDDHNSCLSRSIGSVAVDMSIKGGRVVSTGYNGPPSGLPRCNDKEWIKLTEGRYTAGEIDHIKNHFNLEACSTFDHVCESMSSCEKCPRALAGNKSGEGLDKCSCLTYDSIIHIDGVRIDRIGSLVDRRYSGCVISYNLETDSFEGKPVIGWHKIPYGGSGLYRIHTKYSYTSKFDTSGAKYTGDHKILTLNGWTRVDHLKEGDTICITKGVNASRSKFSGPVKFDQVTKIELLDQSQNVDYVYCIDVQDNHNFCTDNHVAHNCVHSEANCIARSSESMLGCTLYIYGAAPCKDCAKLIINSGISRVVAASDSDSYSVETSWMFNRAGVSLEIVSK